jgi:uncharacterized membrane protein
VQALPQAFRWIAGANHPLKPDRKCAARWDEYCRRILRPCVGAASKMEPTQCQNRYETQKLMNRENSAAVHERVGKLAKLTSTGWWLLTFFALVNGLEGLRYALPHVPLPVPLPNFLERREWLVAHAVFSSVALLTGPWQFLSNFRSRSLRVHRWMGRVYMGTVAAGWLTSLPIAAHAQTGRVASAGFLALGAAWIGTTAAGYRAIRLGQVQAHREWMTRSYALTAAAITLRLYLPIVLVTHAPFAAGYGLVAWICWIPNLLFAEWLVRLGRTRTAGLSA